jgi:hypothetical protein
VCVSSTDVLKLTYKDFPEKLSETVLLTVASLTNRFMKLPGNSQHKVRLCNKTALLSVLLTQIYHGVKKLWECFDLNSEKDLKEIM